jgi:hypothetical protein
MPGTLVRDALAPNILTGATLNAAGSTNGTIVEVVSPRDIAFILETGTVTGTTPTLTLTIQGSDSATFASGVVTYATIVLTGTTGAQSNTVRQVQAYAALRYLRATVVLGGTSPVYTGSTLTPRQEHDRRTKATTA